MPDLTSPLAPIPAQQKPSSSVKLVLLGEAAVGKSSLVLRFVKNDFQENKEPTIGAAFLTQKCALPNRTIKFEIWDTAGQERFASLAPMYYRNAQAALVVYDVTKPSSLVKAKHWVSELQRQASPGIVIALAGNKLDLTSGMDEGGGAEPENGAVDPVVEAQQGGEQGGQENETTAEQDNEGNESADSTAAQPPTSTSASSSSSSPPLGEEEEGQEGAPASQPAPEFPSHAITSPTAENVRQISAEEASTYANNESLLFFETSAKNGINVNEIFTAIANAIPESNLKGPRNVSGSSSLGNGGGGRDDPRVNLRERNDAASESCAC